MNCSKMDTSQGENYYKQEGAGSGAKLKIEKYEEQSIHTVEMEKNVLEAAQNEGYDAKEISSGTELHQIVEFLPTQESSLPIASENVTSQVEKENLDGAQSQETVSPIIEKDSCDTKTGLKILDDTIQFDSSALPASMEKTVKSELPSACKETENIIIADKTSGITQNSEIIFDCDLAESVPETGMDVGMEITIEADVIEHDGPEDNINFSEAYRITSRETPIVFIPDLSVAAEVEMPVNKTNKESESQNTEVRNASSAEFGKSYKKNYLIQKAFKRTSWQLRQGSEEFQPKKQKPNTSNVDFMGNNNNQVGPDHKTLSLINNKLDTIQKQNTTILAKLDQLMKTGVQSIGQSDTSGSFRRSTSVMSGQIPNAKYFSETLLNDAAKFKYDSRYPDITVSWLSRRRSVSTREFIKELLRKLFKWEDIVGKTATGKNSGSRKDAIDNDRKDFIYKKVEEKLNGYPRDIQKAELSKVNMAITARCNEVTKLKDKKRYYKSLYSDSDDEIMKQPAGTSMPEPSRRILDNKTKTMIRKLFEESEQDDTSSTDSEDESSSSDD